MLDYRVHWRRFRPTVPLSPCGLWRTGADMQEKVEAGRARICKVGGCERGREFARNGSWGLGLGFANVSGKKMRAGRLGYARCGRDGPDSDLGGTEAPYMQGSGNVWGRRYARQAGEKTRPHRGL